MTKTLELFLEAHRRSHGDSEDESAPADISEEKPALPGDVILQCTWSNRAFKLYNVWNYLHNFYHCFTVQLSETGILFQRQMDGSHVAMVAFHLDAQDFREFAYNRPEPLKFQINLEKSATKLQSFDAQDDEFTLRIDEGALAKRQIKCTARKIHFIIPMVSEEEEERDDDMPQEPAVPFHVSVTVQLAELVEMLNFASKVAEYIKFKASPRGETFTLFGEDEEGSKFFKDLQPGEGSTVAKRAIAMYSLEYLRDFTKVASKDKLKRFTITLEYSSELPLRLTIPVGRHSYIRGYQAPRVEDDYMEDELKNGMRRLAKLVLYPLLFKS